MAFLLSSPNTDVVAAALATLGALQNPGRGGLEVVQGYAAGGPRAAQQGLFCGYVQPAAAEPDAAFALLDAVMNAPLERADPGSCGLLASFAAWWLDRGEAPQKKARPSRGSGAAPAGSSFL